MIVGPLHGHAGHELQQVGDHAPRALAPLEAGERLAASVDEDVSAGLSKHGHRPIIAGRRRSRS